jgi:hypothetical protein
MGGDARQKTQARIGLSVCELDTFKIDSDDASASFNVCGAGARDDLAITIRRAGIRRAIAADGTAVA